MNEAIIGVLVVLAGLAAEYLRRRWAAADEQKMVEKQFDILLAEEDDKLNEAIRKGDYETIRIIGDARAARRSGMSVTPQK